MADPKAALSAWKEKYEVSSIPVVENGGGDVSITTGKTKAATALQEWQNKYKITQNNTTTEQTTMAKPEAAPTKGSDLLNLLTAMANNNVKTAAQSGKLAVSSPQETAGVAQRIGNTVSGAVKNWAAAAPEIIGTAIDHKTEAEKYKNIGLANMYADQLAKGKTGAAEKLAQVQKAQASDVNRKAAQLSYQKADELAAAGAEDIAKAKDGLGSAGQLLVDVGAGATQLAADLGTGLLIGGASPVMAARVFGSSAQEARNAGATLGQRTAYGASSAAVSLLTEKLSNVGGVFKKAYGAGVLDDVLNKLAKKPAGALAVSALSEGSEEFIEALAQPLLQKITYDPSAAYDAEWLSDALYSATIGAALGGFGAAVSPSTYQSTQTDGNARTVAHQTEQFTQSKGTDAAKTKAPQNASESVSGDVMTREAQRLFGQKKPASTRETAINDDPAQHTPQEQSVIEAYKQSSDQKLRAFIEKVRTLQSNDYRNKIRTTIDTVTTRAAEKAAELTGVDTSGYTTIIKGNSIQHIDKRHGANGKADNSMANIEDFSRIGFVLDNFTDAQIVTENDMDSETAKLAKEWMNSDNTRAQMVRFSMPVNGTYYVVEAIPDSNAKNMAVISAYMTNGVKKGSSLNHVLNMNQSTNVQSPQRTPAAPHEMLGSSKITVSHTDPIVKPQNNAAGAPENAGSPTALGEAENSVGAANAGFTVPPEQRGTEKTSRLAESMPYNRYEAEATALTKEDYAKIFRYESQTEARSMSLAEELLYVIKDGQRTFLRDVSEDAYQSITNSLRDATAWNGPQTDAARIIREYLKGQSIAGEITSEEYTEWLETIREHATATGQGVQANAKWSRTDNEGGQATELDAWKALEKSNLTDAQKQETFQRIVKWDSDIETVSNGDTATLKDIIMQVAQERGVVSGPFGKAFAKLAESSLDSLTFDQLKQFAYSSTAALANDSTPADMGRKLKTIQVLNMLSSPKTAARNLVGNTSFYGIDALAMNGASLLDMAVSRLTGTRSVAAEGLPSMSGAAKATQMALAEITLDVDMDGNESRYGNSGNRTFKASGNIVERVLSALERNQAYLLTATDEFYKGAAKGTEKGTQKLVERGKIKTTDAEYASKQAAALAKYRTFQDDSKISVAIQQIHDVLNLVGVGDSGKAIKGKTVHAFGAGDIVAPFTRVAGNLVSRGVEYSPVNAAKGVVEIVQQVVKAASGQSVDPAAQAKAVSDTARGMTGTAIAYGFMVLAKAGLLRQAEDEDNADVAALNQSEGISGTQLNLTAAKRVLEGGSSEWQYGDTLVDLASIEPLNLLMNLGTEMAKEGQNPIVSAFKATLDSSMDATTELPIMQTIGNMATDIVKYNQDPKEVIAEEVAKTLLSSAVPNALAGVAKGLDDRPRNTYTGDDLWSVIQDAFKNKIPGLRETLPGSVNSMGEEKLYQEGEAGLFNALFNPIGVNTYTQSQVSQEMERVREKTGETSFYPESTIPKTLTADGEELNLTYEQRQQFQRDRGTTQMLVTANVIASSTYKKASASKQAALLDRCSNYAYEIAKSNVLGIGAADKWVINAKNAQKEMGVSTAEWLILYEEYGDSVLKSGDSYNKTKEAIQAGIDFDTWVEYTVSTKGIAADKDANGKSIAGSAKKKVLNAINALDLTAAEKDWLYYLNDYAESTINDAPWH